MKKIRMDLLIEVEQREWLEKEKERINVSMADLIRRAINLLREESMKKLIMALVIFGIMASGAMAAKKAPEISEVPCDVQCGDFKFEKVFPQEYKATGAAPVPEVILWASWSGGTIKGKCVGSYFIKPLLEVTHIP